MVLRSLIFMTFMLCYHRCHDNLAALILVEPATAMKSLSPPQPAVKINLLIQLECRCGYSPSWLKCQSIQCRLLLRRERTRENPLRHFSRHGVFINVDHNSLSRNLCRLWQMNGAFQRQQTNGNRNHSFHLAHSSNRFVDISCAILFHAQSSNVKSLGDILSWFIRKKKTAPSIVDSNFIFICC